MTSKFDNIDNCITELRGFVRIYDQDDDNWSKVYLKDWSDDDDELLYWIAKNSTGHWTSEYASEYYFELEEDAMAVKLAWI